MADRIRIDKPVIDRDTTTAAREPVQYDGAGGFEVRDPGPSLLIPWVKTTAVASTTGGNLAAVYGTSGVQEFTLPIPFRLVGIQIDTPGNMSGGSLTVRVRKAGVEVASLVLATGKHVGIPLGWRNGPQFAAGDILSVIHDTDAAFAPSQNVMTHLLIAARP
ncbi:MAG: hypothetical protein K0S37_1986 [Microbacterium sp.]|jgi:hypothetical protein|nr:hypothetical protein [Microbacterium sp.]